MPETLATYPYVVVRLSCTMCPRKGQYRLARLVERYGAEMRFPSSSSSWRAAVNTGDDRDTRCGAVFVDLGAQRPPDLPPSRES